MTEGRFSCGTSSSCSCFHRREVAFELIALHYSVEDHSENSAFFKFFKDRETFEEFSCKTLLYHRDKSQQHTRDLYWFGLLTYSSPQATPLENSLKTLVKTPYKKQGTLANTCPCASLFSTSFARDNLTFHTSTTQSIAFDDLVAEI